MTVPQKSNSLQTYQVVVYNRALHPELFALRGRRVVRHDGYELEAWLTPGGHVLRFERGPLCASELVTWQEGNLPASGVVTAFLCAGERDFEHRFDRHGVTYMTTVQTETLSEHLYDSTYQELLAHGAETMALCHEYEEEAGRCLSVLEVQRFAREVHCQGFHLQASGGVVVRTQTLFEYA